MSCSGDESFVTAESDSDLSFVSFDVDDHTQSLGELLRDVFHKNSKLFNVCHINAQSIPAHLSDLLESFDSACINAVLVSETFLKPSLPSSFFPIPGYVLVRNDRTGKGNGGVAIYLKCNISYKVVCQSPSFYSASPEYLFLEVDFGSKVLLGVVYCPPNITTSNKYLDKLESVLENLTSDYTHSIVMGDFNTCLLSNPKSSKLKNIIESVNLNILNSEPTHHTATSDTLLDLIITSDVDLVAKHGQICAPAFSHHDLLYLSYNIRLPKPKPITLSQRNFSRMDITKLNEDASEMNWIEVENLVSVDNKVEFFNKSIISLFDSHAPIRSVKLKHTPSHWITDDIRKAMARRDRAFRKYKRNRCDDNWASYKKIRNRCNLLVRYGKKHYISEQIELATPAGLWKFLRTLGIGRPKCLAPKLVFDLNTLNTHFSCSAKLNASAKSEALTDIHNLSTPNIQSFSFSYVSQDRIQKTLVSLKSKAVGSDNISRIMISYILLHLLPTLTHIVNFSLSFSQFPDQWRQAYVIPLPKVSNPTLLKQYRPISILPFLSKIIESIVHSQLTDFLSVNRLFNPFQSGFRRGHSTTSALLNVTEDIRRNMDESRITVLVLIDFSNAFNVVDHDLLLAILPKLNLSPSVVKWFSSYLNGRRQRTRDGQDFSEWEDIETGVPQGGILSPLLFSLFISLLPPHFLSQYHMYADDLQLYSSDSVNNLDSVIQTLNDDLSHLLSWSNRFGISVNPDKCQAIIIGSSRQLSKINSHYVPPCLFYNDTIIPFSQTVTNLGVTFDARLSWVSHIKEVSRKFYAALHSIIRLKRFLPRSAKITLVNSLLIPIIDYADVAYLDLSEELLNKLDRLLNTCIRFIFCLRKYDHVSHFRAELKWLPIRERRNLRILCILFSTLKDPLSPTYLKTRFNLRTDTHNRNLRSDDNLLLDTPAHNTCFRGNSFSVEAVRLWNSLPFDIRRVDTKERFKRLTRDRFLKQIYG